MTKFAMITDAGKLTSEVTSSLKSYSKVFEKLHVVAISCIWLAGKTGDNRPLNKLYEGLNSNDQQAMRLYVRRANIIVGLNGQHIPEGMPSEKLEQAEKAGQVLSFSKGEFSVSIKDGHNSKEAKLLFKLCEDRFLNPDGENDKMVFIRNNITETKILGDADILGQLIRLGKSLDNTNENRIVKVSSKTADFIRKAADTAAQMKSQFDLAVEKNTVAGNRRASNKGEAVATAH